MSVMLALIRCQSVQIPGMVDARLDVVPLALVRS
jgi:hypothetical protein